MEPPFRLRQGHAHGDWQAMAKTARAARDMVGLAAAWVRAMAFVQVLSVQAVDRLEDNVQGQAGMTAGQDERVIGEAVVDVGDDGQGGQATAQVREPAPVADFEDAAAQGG